MSKALSHSLCNFDSVPIPFFPSISPEDAVYLLLLPPFNLTELLSKYIWKALSSSLSDHSLFLVVIRKSFVNNAGRNTPRPLHS